MQYLYKLRIDKHKHTQNHLIFKSRNTFQGTTLLDTVIPRQNEVPRSEAK